MGRAPFRSISLKCVGQIKCIGQIKRNSTKFSGSEGLRPPLYLAQARERLVLAARSDRSEECPFMGVPRQSRLPALSLTHQRY